MMRLSPQEIASLIQEDLPYLDLTTEALGLRDGPGSITFRSRQPTVVAGTEIAVQLLEYQGAQVHQFLPSGHAAAAGDILLMAEGRAAALHGVWRVAANVLEYSSGIAGRASRLVKEARAHCPGIVVAGTRKHYPGTRRLSVMAALAGGVFPHRLGLSETMLVFRQHLEFLGGLPVFLERLPALRRSLPSVKILVEVERSRDALPDALALAMAGVDGIQFDKLSPDSLRDMTGALRSAAPGITVFAAGGIGEDNVAEYAATGVDVLVTSAIYHAPPADIGARILPMETGNSCGG